MAAAGTADIEADMGAATTEEDVFTTQDTTDTAAAGVTSPVDTILGGYCRSLSRTLTTVDTDMVLAMGTATARVRDTGTVIDGFALLALQDAVLPVLSPNGQNPPADSKGMLWPRTVHLRILAAFRPLDP
jgi:hypothetical protein